MSKTEYLEFPGSTTMANNILQVSIGFDDIIKLRQSLTVGRQLFWAELFSW